MVGRHRVVVLAATGLVAAAGVNLAASGGWAGPPPRTAVATSTAVPAAGARLLAARAATPRHLVVTAPSALTANWTTVALVRGHPAAWVAQRSATLMRFEQSLVHLDLHAGSSDGGVVGWTYGDQISPSEIHVVVAAFNGGFKLGYGGGSGEGFMAGGHVAVPLKPELASIVTYTDGTSNIGSWQNGVPSSGREVFSVLQNQYLLVDRGVAAANVTTCVLNCWGGTIQNLTVVARSGLGITSSGQLVWAAGEQLSPAQLADALVSAGAVRAIELDINPAWVAGYLYVHHASGPAPVPVVPGQRGIAGQLLAPSSRDFLTVIAN